MSFRNAFGSTFGSLVGAGLGLVFLYQLPGLVCGVQRWWRERVRDPEA